MRKLEDFLLSKFAQGKMPKAQFIELIEKKCDIDTHLAYEMLIAQGFPIFEHRDFIYLKSYYRSIEKETFCIVDIETNGSKPESSQVIEIGAYKVRNFEIIDAFSSLIYASFVPEYITKVTNIDALALANSPSQKSVLQKFRLFLGDATFVAHNVKFDYNYLSAVMHNLGIGVLSNRKVCSIDLAQRTIKSEKYGLEALSETVGFELTNHHRALSDALATAEIFKVALKNLPQNVQRVEELIGFSKSAPRLKK